MDLGIKGRRAIVTGGSRGLGKEIAEGLAEAGAALMLCARRDEWLSPTVNEMRERDFKAEGMICDVSNPEQVQQVVDKAVPAERKSRPKIRQNMMLAGIASLFIGAFIAFFLEYLAKQKKA